jgi:hypothetical protein
MHLFQINDEIGGLDLRIVGEREDLPMMLHNEPAVQAGSVADVQGTVEDQMREGRLDPVWRWRIGSAGDPGPGPRFPFARNGPCRPANETKEDGSMAITGVEFRAFSFEQTGFRTLPNARTLNAEHRNENFH